MYLHKKHDRIFILGISVFCKFFVHVDQLELDDETDNYRSYKWHTIRHDETMMWASL